MPVFWTRNKSEVDQAKHRVRYPQLKTQALHWTQYLNFNDHVYTLTSSVLSTLYQISRVRHLFTKPVLSTVLNSLIFSKPFYCSTVWAGTSKQNLQKLQYYQCKTSPPAYQQILKSLFTSRLFFGDQGGPPSKISYQSVILRNKYKTKLNKIVNNLAPMHLCSKLSKRSDAHNCNTRKKRQSKSPSMQNSYCATVILLSRCKCLELSDRRHQKQPVTMYL